MARRNLIIALAVTGLFALAVAIPLSVQWAKSRGVDSGVVACQKMAENYGKKSTPTSNKAETNEVTNVQYHQARKPFEDSKIDRLRYAGTNFVDTVYKAKTAPDDLGSSLTLLTELQAEWEQLRSACGEQGVRLPSLVN